MGKARRNIISSAGNAFKLSLVALFILAVLMPARPANATGDPILDLLIDLNSCDINIIWDCNNGGDSCASNYGQWCFVENACGSATEGTYDCSGRCDAVPRPIPDGWSPPCNPPSCSYSGTLSWAPGCSGYFSGTVTDDRWYYTDNTASGYSGRFAWWCRNGTWTQTGLGGEVITWCNADAVPPPPPICSPLNGNACTSAPNLLCGITSTGTINCSGACSAVTPPDSSCPPPPPPCFSDCSKANQVCTGKTFTDANNCGTNNCQGTRSCDYNWKEVAP